MRLVLMQGNAKRLANLRGASIGPDQQARAVA